MIFRKKAAWEKSFPEGIANRVAKIPTAELEMWAEQVLFDLGRCLSQYARNRDVIYLKEALLGAESLNAVVDSLVDRQTR